jgi:hypothetical protein
MNWKGTGRKRTWPSLSYSQASSGEELRKITKGKLSEYPIFGPRFEPVTSRICSRDVEL